MGEIHELFVLALSLVWFARVTPDFKGGDLKPGERHSHVARDDGTVTLCALRAATVLSRD